MEARFFKFECRWNGNLAAKGYATPAFAAEMIRNFVCGNFVNVAKCKTPPCGPFPSLDDITAARGVISSYCADDTGRAVWTLEPVANPGEWNK